MSVDFLRSEQYWIEYFAEKEDFDYDYDYERGPSDVCLYIGESLESRGIKDFQIVEGYIWADGYREGIQPTSHPWIEFNDGSIIDLFAIEWWGVDSNELDRIDCHCMVLTGNGLYKLFENKYYNASEYSSYLKYT